MIASILPVDAKRRAVDSAIPFFKANINVTSELNGNIVAAKKAEKKSANSAI